MQKKFIILITIFLLVFGLFGGCTQDSNTGLDESKDMKYFTGIWFNDTYFTNSSGVNYSFVRIYNFTDTGCNYTQLAIIGSNRYYGYNAGTYEIKNGNLILSYTTPPPARKDTFRYSFSYNYTALTLVNETGFLSIFYK